MTNKLKQVMLLASYIYPYKGEPLSQFWRNLDTTQQFMAFYRVHEILKLEGVSNEVCNYPGTPSQYVGPGADLSGRNSGN